VKELKMTVALYFLYGLSIYDITFTNNTTERFVVPTPYSQHPLTDKELTSIVVDYLKKKGIREKVKFFIRVMTGRKIKVKD
jgi:hypothetical protein